MIDLKGYWKEEHFTPTITKDAYEEIVRDLLTVCYDLNSLIKYSRTPMDMENSLFYKFYVNEVGVNKEELFWYLKCGEYTSGLNPEIYYCFKSYSTYLTPMQLLERFDDGVWKPQEVYDVLCALYNKSTIHTFRQMSVILNTDKVEIYIKNKDRVLVVPSKYYAKLSRYSLAAFTMNDDLLVEIKENPTSTPVLLNSLLFPLGVVTNPYDYCREDNAV